MDTALILVGTYFVALVHGIGCRAVLGRWGLVSVVLALVPLACFAIVYLPGSPDLPWPYLLGAILGSWTAQLVWDRGATTSRVPVDASRPPA